MRLLAFVYLVLFFFITGQLQAQQKVQVRDDISNLPIVGVNVTAENKTVLTDADGFFDLTEIVSFSDTLLFSSVGYITKTMTLHEITNDLIYLSPIGQFIDEVTVKGERNLSESLPFKKLASMKNAVYAFGAALVGDSICVIGGDASMVKEFYNSNLYEYHSSKMQIYDIKKNQWSISDRKFSSRAYHNIHYHKGKIYVLGGKRLAPNPRREYLNDVVEVYHIKQDTIYSSHSNPHQAVNFASGVFNDHIVVMNGSVKQYHKRKRYTKKVHLFDLKTGFWYERETIPYAYETTAIVVDSILYQVGGFNQQAVPFVNAYNLRTGEHATEAIIHWMERPALACNEADKTIYIYENGLLITYNVLTKKIIGYPIQLNLRYSAMVYKEGFLYIMGGYEYAEFNLRVPSNRLYRIDLKDLNNTKSYVKYAKQRQNN